MGDLVGPVVNDVAGPLLDDLANEVSPLTEPVLAPVGSVLEPLSPLVSGLGLVLAGVDPLLDPVVDLLSPVLAPVLEVADPVIDPLAPILDPVIADTDDPDDGPDGSVLPIEDPVAPVTETPSTETPSTERSDPTLTGGAIGVDVVGPVGSAPPRMPGPLASERGAFESQTDLAAPAATPTSQASTSIEQRGESGGTGVPGALLLGSPASATMGTGSSSVSAGDLAVPNQSLELALAAVACAVALTLARRARRAPSARPGFSPD